jgi:Holliday junction DNA helicase RuvB
MLVPPLEYTQLVQLSSPRPSTWDDVIGNTTAVEILQEQIAAAAIDHKPVPHVLLFGSPGTGKSTLSKILATSTGGRYIETTASTLETMSDLLRLCYQIIVLREETGIAPIVFLDEIHTLGRGGQGRQSIDQESMFTLLEDWKVYHNMMGKVLMRVNQTHENPQGDEFRLHSNTCHVWPFTMVGATTEPGMLSDALRRRFLVHIDMEAYTDTEIAEIIRRAAARMGWAIDSDAATHLSAYARRNPGRGYQLLTQARNRAVVASGFASDEATRNRTITRAMTEQVIARLHLYPLGLTDTDVRILKILAERHPKGVGQAELARAANISLSQFTAMIEPYLRQLDFVEITSRRVIKPLGLAYLLTVDSRKPGKETR